MLSSSAKSTATAQLSLVETVLPNLKLQPEASGPGPLSAHPPADVNVGASAVLPRLPQQMLHAAAALPLVGPARLAYVPYLPVSLMHSLPAIGSLSAFGFQGRPVLLPPVQQQQLSPAELLPQQERYLACTRLLVLYYGSL